MEVYHHPQVEKKSFKGYFLEFLMIFLAVTLGFFAENIREYFSNNERAEQLTQELVQQLKNDTSVLNLVIGYQTRLQEKADTLFNMLREPIKEPDVKKFQNVVNDCYQITTFTPSSGAISAIKNELSLKQFSSTEIGTYITGYETESNQASSLEKTQTEQVREVIQKFMQEHFSADDLHALRITHTDNSGKLRKTSADDLDKFRADMVGIEDFNRLLLQEYKYCMENAVSLM